MQFYIKATQFNCFKVYYNYFLFEFFFKFLVTYVYYMLSKRFRR